LKKTLNSVINIIKKTKQNKTHSKKNRGLYPFLFIGFWCLVFGISFLFSQGIVYAAPITLAWDSSSGAVGYKIYSGTTSNSYSWVVDVGNVTSYTTTDLTNGYIYYFAATAYDSSSRESDYSSEVSYTNTTANTTQTTYIISASAGTGGTISPSGSVSVTSGSSRTFTITPNSGYRISNVTVNGSSVGAVSSYSFSNVTANRTISATFSTVTTYTLTTTTTTGTGAGTITRNPTSTTFSAGTVVTLTATADTSSVFTGWSGACSGTSTTCRVTMNANTSVSAVFAAQSFLNSGVFNIGVTDDASLGGIFNSW
jgi:hypothetical protein